jgi:hypothetical protein
MGKTKRFSSSAGKGRNKEVLHGRMNGRFLLLEEEKRGNQRTNRTGLALGVAPKLPTASRGTF